MEKKFDFEDEPYICVPLILDFTYSYIPARLGGLPENCCPEDEEIELTPPDGYRALIIEAYLKEARAAIDRLEAKFEQMKNDGTVQKWAEEAAESAAEDRAEYLMEQRRARSADNFADMLQGKGGMGNGERTTVHAGRLMAA